MYVEDEEMVPVAVVKPQDLLSVQYFIAIPGKAFYFRIKLDRSPPQGTQYGCRVYVDNGGLDHRHVFNLAKGALEEQTMDGKSVDESVPDHFFWFGPGETSYTVRGYYCSSDEEYEFNFSKLPKDDQNLFTDDQEQLRRQSNQIGIVRFQFSKVEKMIPRVKDNHRCPVPTRPTDYSDAILYKKGVHLSTEPGKRLKTGEASLEEAVLCSEVIYESRIYFNDLCGYQTRATNPDTGIPNVYKEPSRLQALPMSEFTTTTENRKRYLDLFLTWLQNKRYERMENSDFVAR